MKQQTYCPVCFQMRLVGLFFLLSALYFTGRAGAQSNPEFSIVRFRQMTPLGGLYHNGIRSITQDGYGYIWFHTVDELFRFDAYKFKRYMDLDVGNKIVKNPQFNYIFNDSHNRLWIATNLGLFRYDPKTLNFVLEINPGRDIIRVLEDSTGHIWILTASRLYRYDPDRKSLHLLPCSPPESESFSTFALLKNKIWVGTSGGTLLCNLRQPDIFGVTDIPCLKTSIREIANYQDHLYLLTENLGLFHYHINGKRLNTFTFFLEDPEIRGNNLGRTLLLENPNKIWIGTHRGLYLFNSHNQKYQRFQSNVNDLHSLPNNSVWTLSKDRQGGLWIGTYSGGLAYTNQYDHQFFHVKHTNNRSQNNNYISSFAEDKTGNIWVGTEGGGLDYYSRQSNTFTHFQHQEGTNSLSYDNVKALITDHNDNLWIGMYNGGLDFFDRKSRTFTNYRHRPTDLTSLSSNTIYALQLEGDSGLWIATQSEGIDFFHFRKKKISHYKANPNDKNALGYHFINGLFRGSNDRLWIATRHGLNLLYIRNNQFKQYYFNKSDTINYGSNEIFCVFEDSRKKVWIGTKGYGLFSFDPQNDTFVRHPFPANPNPSAVYGILEDKQDNLWLSTNEGLFKYNRPKREFVRFDRSDGLQGNLFYPNACLKSKSGDLIFGGTNGFTIFNPGLIKQNPILPKAFLTGFYVNNQHWDSIPSAKEKFYRQEKDFSFSLNYQQTTFGFDVTAFNYLIPEKNRFAYKLEGYDKTWNETSASNRYISYSNLPSGSYVFRIKASNNDGVFGNFAPPINVRILPPPWESWWAYTIYMLVLAGSAASILRIYHIRRNYRTQLEIERLEKEKMEELNKLKIQFFTNVSHEFKTPLTLILSPLKKLIKKPGSDSENLHLFDLIHKNVLRLQHLINELMDFRELETSKIRIHETNGNIISFIRDLSILFRPIAEEKNVNFTFESNLKSVHVYFDHDIIEKIFSNLLSNAVKFTPEGESIAMKLDISEIERSDKVNLVVDLLNTGTTISDEQQTTLFLSYYNINRTETPLQKSSGVGLAFTKQLVDQLLGTIMVKSKDNVNRFIVNLPMAYAPAEASEDISSGKIYNHSFYYSKEMVHLLAPSKKPETSLTDNSTAPLILIVEDNDEMREYLGDSFREEYRVILGTNGKEGLVLARDKNPSIMILDVMMPNMTGLELCALLKSELVTSHIPIIFLSALSTPEQKMEGMATGADVYLEKPFDLDYLKLQVKNLLHSKEANRKAFPGKISPEPMTLAITPTDEIFINKAIVVVEKYIDDTDFGVDDFVKEIGVGRTLVYQKIKALTDLSVNDFILNIRLKRAAQLLRDSDFTISEVAYKVGFKEPKYFSTCFKKFFHKTPSAYLHGFKDIDFCS